MGRGSNNILYTNKNVCKDEEILALARIDEDSRPIQLQSKTYSQHPGELLRLNDHKVRIQTSQYSQNILSSQGKIEYFVCPNCLNSELSSEIELKQCPSCSKEPLKVIMPDLVTQQERLELSLTNYQNNIGMFQREIPQEFNDKATWAKILPDTGYFAYDVERYLETEESNPSNYVNFIEQEKEILLAESFEAKGLRGFPGVNFLAGEKSFFLPYHEIEFVVN